MVDVDRRSPVIDEEERQSELPHGRPLGLAIAIFVLIVIVISPVFYRPSLDGKLPFSDQALDELNATHPKYVFIGDSMLGTRLDEATLEARLGQNCCYILWTGGGESAWVHQALENDVIAAEHRPKVVFIVFRDTYLTRVTYRTDDAYWWKIERVSHDREPELMRALNQSRSWQERFEYELGVIYPIQKRRERADYDIEWLASQLADPGGTSYGAPIASRYNELFDLARLKNIEAADDSAVDQDDPSLYDFDAALPRSLLPSMIRLAKGAGIQLVFVRVQRRPTADGPPPQRPALLRYMASLRSYLAAQDVGFYDFTGDPDLTLDRYMDGDHIRAAWKPASTELFLRRLHGYFR